MIIPTISHYLWEVRRNKLHMLSAAERRRAFRLCCGIVFCVTVAVLLWILS